VNRNFATLMNQLRSLPRKVNFSSWAWMVPYPDNDPNSAQFTIGPAAHMDVPDSLVSATMRNALFSGTQYECP
jgi:hypothetical protein